MELPLTVNFREGKEFVRDAAGQAEGVVDVTFADVRWGFFAGGCMTRGIERG